MHTIGEAAHNYELNNIYFTMLPSFYDIPNEDPVIDLHKGLLCHDANFPITRAYGGPVENEVFPIHYEGQSPGIAHDPSTKLIENMGSSLQLIYWRVLFPSKDNKVEDKDCHLCTNGG